MRRIATDVSRGLLSFCIPVTRMYPAKTAGPIEMSFGMWARVGQSKHVLDGGGVSGYPRSSSNFGSGHAGACPRSVYSTRQYGLLSAMLDLFYAYIGTALEVFLSVFVGVQNVAGIGGVVSIIMF